MVASVDSPFSIRQCEAYIIQGILSPGPAFRSMYGLQLSQHRDSHHVLEQRTDARRSQSCILLVPHATPLGSFLAIQVLFFSWENHRSSVKLANLVPSISPSRWRIYPRQRVPKLWRNGKIQIRYCARRGLPPPSSRRSGPVPR
jgi:hypothetical protein